MTDVRSWVVGGALIRHGDGLLLVANRRRDGSIDWTPPGGVIDAGEELLEGLAREVLEETGLVVERWTRCAYRVEVEAHELQWVLRVEAWEGEATGDVVIADPDGIVEHVRHVSREEAIALMLDSPLWIQIPVGEWLTGGCDPADERCGEDGRLFRFRLHGADRKNYRTEHLA
jgi:8-oxo-dGTP pyrophosphatase MutT (NUDIX family)